MEAASLGFVETLGYVAAVEAADAGSKAAQVTMLGIERGRAGLITVRFAGDVAAVRAAVTAATVAASRVGTVVTAHVIARPSRQLAKLVPQREKPCNVPVPQPAQVSKATAAVEEYPPAAAAKVNAPAEAPSAAVQESTNAKAIAVAEEMQVKSQVLQETETRPPVKTRHKTKAHQVEGKRK